MGTPVASDGSLCLNVGCGSSPTPGYLNFDNSPTVVLARAPRLSGLLVKAGLLGTYQKRFLEMAHTEGIRWADAARRIPLPDGSARVVYSSHMIEHLDRSAARGLLAEIHRVLRPGGVVRLVAPDLKRLAVAYVTGGSADAFVEQTLLANDQPVGLAARLKLAALGKRDHAWMYDAESLTALVRAAGFAEVRALPPGESMIPDPGALDLHERSSESIYVEAVRP
ncbi:MAG: methyltransferase domain-containing protein [Minicystis sp.]